MISNFRFSFRKQKLHEIIPFSFMVQRKFLKNVKKSSTAPDNSKVSLGSNSTVKGLNTAFWGFSSLQSPFIDPKSGYNIEIMLEMCSGTSSYP